MSYEILINEKWKQLYMILGILIALFLITTTFLFYHRRKQIKDIENRSMRLSITLAISNVIFCPFLVIYNGLHDNIFFCYVILWNIYLSVVIYLAVILSHELRLIFLAQLNYAMLNVSLKTKNRIIINNEGSITEYSKLYRKRTIDSMIFFGLIATIGFFVIVLIGITFSFDKFSMNKDNKCIHFHAFIPLYIYISIFIMSVPILYFFLRSIEDNYGLRRDILKNITFFLFCFVCHILWLTVFEGANRVWGYQMWLSTSLIAGHVTMILFPIIQSYKKRDSTGNEGTRFSQVLQDDVLFEKYKICAASFFCTELMLFIEEYQYLKGIVFRYYKAKANAKNRVKAYLDDAILHEQLRKHRSADRKITPITVSIRDTLVKHLDIPSLHANEKVPKMLRPYFLRLFRTFLEPSADLAINVVDSTIRDVATRISMKDYRINMFETARVEVLQLLHGNTFHTFVEKHKEFIQSRIKSTAENQCLE